MLEKRGESKIVFDVEMQNKVIKLIIEVRGLCILETIQVDPLHPRALTPHTQKNHWLVVHVETHIIEHAVHVEQLLVWMEL